MDYGLSDRTVIVTGASGGIGRELVRRFADEGARVLVTYYNDRGQADRLVNEAGGADRAQAVRYTLDDAESAESLLAAAMEWTGRVDVVINNALMFAGPAGINFEEVPDREWVAVLRENVEGALRLSRLAAPIMRKQKWGRLAHISSSLFVEGMEGFEYYMAAKGALHGFSRSAAFSLGQDGDILSNVAMLGYIHTERNENWPVFPVLSESFGKRAPIRRVITAREVANVLVFLCSAANTAITGQAIPVTGGV